MPAYSIWIATGLFAIAALLWKPLERDRGRIRTAFGLLLFWVAVSLFAAGAPHWNIQPGIANEIARTLLILAAIQIGFLIVFDLVLRRVKLPKFASEIAVLAAYAVALIELLKRLGVDAAGLFATSAVATAVVGLALQDMLANLAGGMTLQLEDSINAGDYVTCGEHSGWVQHVRLRHTSILTPDGDTIMLPNSFLTRSAVEIVSQTHRHCIPFAMPYSQDPHEVIEAVEAALRDSPNEGIAAQPAPSCVVRELRPEHILYNVVVWCSVPGVDIFPLSGVLNRIYYALDRAGIAPGEITHMIEIKSPAAPVEEASPEDVLRRTPIFRLLEDEEMSQLAASLRRVNFAVGEYVFRQGDPGESMYFLVAGRVEVTIGSPDGTRKHLSTFESGDFFGEVSLLTGEPRSVTATAVSRVTCYCLEKTGLQRTVQRQPDLAEDMSVILAHRQFELLAARETLDRETALRREAESQTQILARIRRFFGITGSSAGA